MAEPLNATFFAFKRRERGGVLIGATVAYAICTLVLIAAFVALNWNGFLQIGKFFQAAAHGEQPSDPSGVFAMFAIFGWAILFIFIFYVLIAAYEAACLRWMIHGEVRGFLGLSLGAETWRVYSGYWIWALISFAISFTLEILSLPLVFMTAAGGAAVDPNDPSALMGPIYLLTVGRALLQWTIMAFIGVRFAPGNAASIVRRRFAYFDAWKITKGRFWALFGSFLVLGLLWSVVGGIAFVATGGALLARLWPLLVDANLHPGKGSSEALAAAIFAPQNLGIVGGCYGVLILTGVLFGVLFIGVNARAALAAVEDGKIEGITPGVAKAFE